jgi:hypothetical protein
MGTIRSSSECLAVLAGSELNLNLLFQQTIKFINDEASSVHGALRVGSIYTSESGEWRLGGFEVLSSMKDDDAIIYVCSDHMRCIYMSLTFV